MEVFWYLVIALVVTMFFLLDGYDFGVGIMHLFFAKKEKDKEVIAKSAGLFWDSNEVWLVAAGGLLFMAFPTFYASVFSGFYLPFMLVLWLIIFRAIGLELRGQFKYDMWRSLWDTSFGVASLLLALLFGVALGNVIRGVNLGGVENGVSAYEAHYFFLPLWDGSFSPYSTHPGAIDWFTLTIGLLAVLALAIHGANWIVLKTNSSINEQLKSVNVVLTAILAALSILAFVLWQGIHADSMKNFIQRPYLLLFPLLYVGGIAASFFVKKFKKDVYAVAASSCIIIGGIASSLASLFPVILPSTNASNPALSIYNMASNDYGLSIALRWGVIGLLLLFAYFIIQKRLLAGKVDEMDYGH